jgi:transglutaminase-like putative cysteine protease
MAATGAHPPQALAAMALPLLAAALVEAAGWSLGSWHRWLEAGALAAFLLQLLLRVGFLPLVLNTLCVLCAVRLALPRGFPERRQLLLMGFLLFLSTAVTTAQLDFLLGTTAWLAGSAALLLQLNWERSARLGPGAPPPPRARILGWTLAALGLAAGFFVLLPRLPGQTSRLPRFRTGSGPSAGLSDVLDLLGGGPIQTSRTVVLRIQPPDELADQPSSYRPPLALLRAFGLEQLQGRRWTTSPFEPLRPGLRWTGRAAAPHPLWADFFLEPGVQGVIPVPYGLVDLSLPAEAPLRPGAGGSVLRASGAQADQRVTPVRVALTPAQVSPEAPPRGWRLGLLTDTGLGTPSARAWSLRVAPEELAPRELAERLTGALRSQFRYTLDNPSGTAPDPLQDFLEHSRAGHCEYFASALALMLRYRGVPARVATGYRLGPWIPGGRYFLVTQAEAHSWVEYYDPASGGWRVADPTPAATASPFASGGLGAAVAQWSDTVQFFWDRNVVRFSDQDQLTGAGWAAERAQAMVRRRPGPLAELLAGLALLGGLGWMGWRRRGGWRGPADRPGAIPELRPLLRATRRVRPPLAHETARAWLERLARMRPQRALMLRVLAREVDAVGYDHKPADGLRRLVRDEARHWRK